MKYKKLYKLAFFDKMTDCYNRNWLEENRKKFDKQEMEFAIIDLNGLKETNDKWGHEFGDKRIKNLANFLKLYGTVIRLGGDEFVVIFDKGRELQFDWQCKGNKEFSYGICIKDEKVAFSDALKCADERMYEMKKGE